MTEEEALVDFIQKNKKDFQMNFSFLKPRPKSTANKGSTARMINIKKYQTKEIVIDFFYKKISRTLE